MAITEFQDAALEVRGYDLLVRAYNWVGASADTAVALSCIITVRTDPKQSVLEPTYADAGWLEYSPDDTTVCIGGTVQAAVPEELAVIAHDVDGNRLANGGSRVFAHIEELCTVTDNYRCDRTPDTADVLDGTQYLRMTDAGDGRYSTTINLKRQGTVTVSVILSRVGGFYGEYFNNAFLDGVPTKTQLDSYLDFDWGTGLLTDEAADFVSIQWFGKILPEYTEEYTFIISADDGVRIFIDAVSVVDRWDDCCDDVTFSMDLTADTFYDVIIEYKEHQQAAHFKFEWVSLSVPRDVVPPTRVYYPERMAAGAIPLLIALGPTIASACTAEGDGLTESTAGKRAFFYTQSRDWDGLAVDNPGDVYDIEFVGPAEGTPEDQDGTFAVAASYLENGK